MTHASIADIVRNATPEAIDADQEAALVHAAQTGDQDAMLDLVRQYAPAIRNTLRRMSGALDQEDAAQEAALAFFSLVQVHDPATGRLAGRVRDYLVEGLTGALARETGWAIPERTVKRYKAVDKAANGDPALAVAIAPEHDLSASAYLLVRAIFKSGSIEDLTERAHDDGAASPEAAPFVTGGASDAFVAVEDAILVEGLLSLLDERETAIIRFSYGFDAIPGVDADDAKEGVAKTREEGVAVANDTVVARHLGLTRPTVQRARAKALATMRAALTENA